MSFSVWQKRRMIVQNGRQFGQICNASHDPLCGQLTGCCFEARSSQQGGGGGGVKQTHPVAQIDAAAYLTSTRRRTDREMDRRKSGDKLYFRLIQSVASLSLTQIHFPLLWEGDTLRDTLLHTAMKATDDILISEYWLTDLVSWDNTTFPRLTLLGWSKTAYFRHGESSIKFYPVHEGGLANRNWMVEHHKQCCTSRGHLFIFSASRKNMIGLGLFFFFAVMKWYCGEAGGVGSRTHTQMQTHTETHRLMDANHACPWLMCCFHSNTGSLSSSHGELGYASAGVL